MGGAGIRVTALLGAIAVTVACEQDAGSRRAVPSYDDFTGRLLQLSADQNGDGRIDQWTYLDGNRPLRGESDLDADGRIDRWEYFDPQAALISWAPRAAAMAWKTPGRSLRPTRRARCTCPRRGCAIGCADRHEYFRGDQLVRAEEDTNADGRIDKWERYEGGSLREASFDTSFVQGRPDRRVLYDAKGSSVVEADPDGDGTFVRVPGEAEPPARTPGAVNEIRHTRPFAGRGRPLSWLCCGPARRRRNPAWAAVRSPARCRTWSRRSACSPSAESASRQASPFVRSAGTPMCSTSRTAVAEGRLGGGGYAGRLGVHAAAIPSPLGVRRLRADVLQDYESERSVGHSSAPAPTSC